MSRYHHAAYTLDPTKELPDAEELAPAAGHDDEAAEAVAELAAEHKDAVDAEIEAAAQAAQEAAERDPKPLPSELLQESGREPAPADDQDTATTDVPDGTVQDVLDWAGDDPARIQAALNAERAGQNRSSLISELERRQAAA